MLENKMNIDCLNISDIRQMTKIGFIGIQHSLPNFSVQIFDFLIALRPDDPICNLGYQVSRLLLNDNQALHYLYMLYKREKNNEDFMQVFLGFMKLLGYDEQTLHYKVKSQ